jgi:hydrogenase maturation protease
MQTECLVQTNPLTSLEVKVRFLHLLTREVAKPVLDSTSQSSQYQVVPSLEVNGQLLQSWQEAIERDVSLPAIKLSESFDEPSRQPFSFPATETIEELHDAESKELRGLLVRKQQALAGLIEVRIADCGFRADELQGADQSRLKTQTDRLLRITIQILNETPLESASERTRDEALMRSFVSTHTILNVREGEFVSLLDPPEVFRETAAACSNIGTYPVLVGEEEARHCMLSSPIILYDYPQIAPESAGNLYDGTEIDEILTLRIMTLTDEEKREMRGADDRARQILERTEMMPAEQLMKMHGAMKGVKR